MPCVFEGRFYLLPLRHCFSTRRSTGKREYSDHKDELVDDNGVASNIYGVILCEVEDGICQTQVTTAKVAGEDMNFSSY